MAPGTGYADAARRRRPRWPLLAAIAGGHVLAIIGLAHLLAPDFSDRVIERATSLVTVTVRTYEEPPPPTAPEEAGAAGDPAAEAVAASVSAPPAPVPRDEAAPRAASTGAAATLGASEAGAGTGAAGPGAGTGSGAGGTGRGGGIASGPSVQSGRIDSARDFPIPPGGRRTREGTSVTVVFTVGIDGRASDCSVASPGPDPATNALVCPLVIERIRFNPARDGEGNPVPARYGWRQDFFRP